MSRNVFGEPLIPCSMDPLTGFFRNGCCETGPEDLGTHTVCAVVTTEFLEFTRAKGNDLITARPEYQFPGLKPGDKWCLCVMRWVEAKKSGVAPFVVLEATNEASLHYVTLDELIAHAWKKSY